MAENSQLSTRMAFWRTTGTNPGSNSEHSPYRILNFCLPHSGIRSATSITIDFGAIFPFTAVPACKPPCLRFAVAVAGHHARLGTRLLAKLCRGLLTSSLTCPLPQTHAIPSSFRPCLGGPSTLLLVNL